MLNDLPAPLDLLVVAAAVLAVAAVCLAGVGLRQQPHRGFGLWVAALGLSALGAALCALPGQHLGLRLPGSLLLCLWPMLMLLGLRRFNARRDLPGSARADAWLLGLAAGACLLLGLLPLPASAAIWVVAVLGMGLHLYPAALMFLGPGGRDGTPLQAVGMVIALAGFGPLLAALPGGNTGELLAAQAIGASLGGVVMAFVVLTLSSERTHRQLRASQRRLRVLANLDSLTQVPNRRHFEELASRALAVDPPASASLLLFDIDHFKQINDRMGHAAGDRALQLVAAALRSQLRELDLSGRHGGDEFVLLLRQADTQQAMGLVQRVAREVRRRTGSHRLPALTLSVGLVNVRAGEALLDALARADQALYEAKRQGRSRAVVAEGDAEQPVFAAGLHLELCSG